MRLNDKANMNHVCANFLTDYPCMVRNVKRMHSGAARRTIIEKGTRNMNRQDQPTPPETITAKLEAKMSVKFAGRFKQTARWKAATPKSEDRFIFKPTKKSVK